MSISIIFVGILEAILFFVMLVHLTEPRLEDYKTFFRIVLGTFLFILVWMSAAVINMDQIKKDTNYPAKLIDDVAVVVIDGQIYNMSEAIHQNVKDGQLIKAIKYQGTVFGIYFDTKYYSFEKTDTL